MMDLINTQEHPSRLNYLENNNIGSPNIIKVLNARQLGFKVRTLPKTSNHHVEQIIEKKAVDCAMDKIICDIPNNKSTYIMAVSSDCSLIASAHGNHSIYISDAKTGQRIKVLRGHNRSPWTLQFHPVTNNILASGCLSGEVRVWNLQGRCAKWKIVTSELSASATANAIASIAFHPVMQLLVIASSSCLYFWNWNQPVPFSYCYTNSPLEQIRFVKFHNEKLITGISNFPPVELSRCTLKCIRCHQRVSILEQEASGVVQSSSHNLSEDKTNTRVIAVYWDTTGFYQSEQNSSDNQVTSSYSISILKNSIGSACDIFKSNLENFLQENEIILADPVPSDDSDYRMGNRVAVAEINRKLAAVKNNVNFCPESLRYRMLKERLTQMCRHLEELCHEIQEMFDHGILSDVNVPHTIIASAAALRSKKNALTELLDVIFAPPYHHELYTVTRDTDESGHSSQPPSIHEERNISSVSSRVNEPGHSSQSSSSNIFEERNNSSVPSGVTSQGTQTGRVFHLPSTKGILAARALSPWKSNIWLIMIRDNSPLVHPTEHRSHYNLRSTCEENNCSSSSSQGSSHSQQPHSSSSSHLLNNFVLSESSLGVWRVLSSNQSNRCPKRCQKQPEFVKKQCTHDPTTAVDILKVTPEIKKNVTPTLDGPEQGCSSSQLVSEPSYEENSSEQTFESTDVTDISKFVDIGEFVQPFDSYTSSMFQNSGGMSVRSLNEHEVRSNNSHHQARHYNHEESTIIVTREDSRGERHTRIGNLNIGSVRPPTFLRFSGLPLCQYPYDYRIQCWDFKKLRIPPIHDATANIVVNSCMIHNDATIDICGDKLIALHLPGEGDNQSYRLGVYSLNPKHLGDRLCVWRIQNDPVSISFSPLGQYIIIGTTRQFIDNKPVVIDVIKLCSVNGSLNARYIRGYTRNYEHNLQFGRGRVQLNCVKWLDNGFAYGTNTGAVVICRPEFCHAV